MKPKIYHIVHWDYLRSIASDEYLYCDAAMAGRTEVCTSIDIREIKSNRREKELRSHTGLKVGDCVPFYFAPRSVMLYVIYRRNHPGLHYRGGQVAVVHLEADLTQTVQWASEQNRRWAFTTANAAKDYAIDYARLDELHEIDWEAVETSQWSDPTVKERKQAEFLVEGFFPWELVTRVGVQSPNIRDKVHSVLQACVHRPEVQVKREWYY